MKIIYNYKKGKASNMFASSKCKNIKNFDYKMFNKIEILYYEKHKNER